MSHGTHESIYVQAEFERLHDVVPEDCRRDTAAIGSIKPG